MNSFKYTKPIFMILLINLLGCSLIALITSNHDVEIIYSGLFVIGILTISYIVVKLLGKCDGYIFLIVSMLFSIGEIMLFRISLDLGKKQVLWLIFALLFFFVIYCLILTLNIWTKLGYSYYVISVILFVITLIFGSTISGSRNWIEIGNFTVQPSEIIKILVVFLLADRYEHPEKYRYKNLNPSIVSSILIYSIIGLMVLQREWGTSLLLLLIHFSLMFIFNEEKWMLILNILSGIIIGVIGCLLVPHIKVRIDVWLNPWSDVMGTGYQITQSLFAITNGGFLGVGLGQGSPEFIPEVHSDFIFSAICEEFGLFGGIAVIMLYFLLVYRGFRISMKIPNTFYKVIAVGISCMFGYQSFIILGGVTKLIPLTGITLPFISYGGSSLLVSFASIAILEAISNKEFYIEDDFLMVDKDE